MAVSLLVVSAASQIYSSDWFQKKFAYPFLYQELIFTHAAKNQLDPWLIAAVIKAESRFRLTARSPVGAVGLMQLMPETAKWIAGQQNHPDFQLKDLENPDANIRFGSWYLASLAQEFNQNEVLMLAAYNAGRGNVKKWMEQYGWAMDFSEIGQIPFPETREFIADVLHNKKRYQELHAR
ncbi:MAG: lytic transglycosylase domain-containing protein [Sporomusaceae bacterium]|nr:lytic transglycosylase domain-containing protein [Sporomusaceae bacterium]